MGEERLNGLAKLYIHRELTNDDLIENFVTAVTGIFFKKRTPPKKKFIDPPLCTSYKRNLSTSDITRR